MSDESEIQANPDAASSGDAPPIPQPKHAGGVVHSYQRYDPKNFPSPTAPPPDMASAAMEHMLEFGSTRDLTPEELAKAIRLDPSMFPRLGPSIESLRRMLEERKAKILSTYETEAAQKDAKRASDSAAREARPPREQREEFLRAAKREQIADLENLWYRQKKEGSDFAKDLLTLMEALGAKYQIEEMAGKYAFTGRTEMGVEEALAVKEELETIDKLLEQLKTAAETAQLAIIDMDELSEFADTEQIEQLNEIQKMVEEYVREEAKRQGIEESGKGYRLTPAAMRVFQRKVLQEIFSDLQAARSGRHAGPIAGEGAVELQRTKAYEFGDSASHIDIIGTVGNAVARSAARAGPNAGDGRLRISMDDLQTHLTKNNPKCASVLCMDMSGSMRFGGQYVQCKRMALALDGLIRTEYPGDFVGFVEMFSLAKRRSLAEVPALMPKPVSIRSSVVRLKADMSDPRVSEMQLPQHFTNLQHGLQIARQILQVQDTPNRQVMLITDGLPTAHFEGKELFLLYPPDPRTEEATMREARLCVREGITINVFLLPNWNQTSEDVQFAHRLAETTKGRVFFTGGRDLDRFVLWDYVSQRRKIIG
jgi:uncharacterized protein with von Willebrand factor type A (vWA) domain